MYVLFFFVVWCRRGYWGTLAMVTDGANVLSVRSRTTRSSKGKASAMLSLLGFDIQSDLFPFLSPFIVTPSRASQPVSITSSFPTRMPTPNNSPNN